MSKYNLQTYRQMFLSRAFPKPLSTASEGHAINDTEIFDLLNHACMRIQQDYALHWQRDSTGDLVVGQSSYTMPDVIFRMVDEVKIKKSTGGNYPLKYLTYKEFHNCFDLDDLTDDSGDPQYWTYDVQDTTKILIRPVPTEAVTDGLIFHAAEDVGEMSRIYLGSRYSNTASVAYNSTAVTFASDPNSTPGLAIQYDAIGFIRGTNVDGTTATDDVPRTWYLLNELSGTSGTLNTAMREPVFSNANFVIAEVSKLESIIPGGMGWAPVYFALADYFERTKPDFALQMEAKGRAEVANIDYREPSQDTDHAQGKRMGMLFSK